MRHSAQLADRIASPSRRQTEGSGLFGLFGLIAAVTLLMLGVHLWRDYAPVLEAPSVNAARATPPVIQTVRPADRPS